MKLNDKIDSISETLKYSSNKEIYYKGLEKNVTGTFWFIYKKA